MPAMAVLSRAGPSPTAMSAPRCSPNGLEAKAACATQICRNVLRHTLLHEAAGGAGPTGGTQRQFLACRRICRGELCAIFCRGPAGAPAPPKTTPALPYPPPPKGGGGMGGRGLPHHPRPTPPPSLLFFPGHRKMKLFQAQRFSQVKAGRIKAGLVKFCLGLCRL